MNLMEIDIVTLFSYIVGTFLIGTAIGGFIEGLKNKRTYENAYEPIISKYLQQKDKMFDKALRRMK